MKAWDGKAGKIKKEQYSRIPKNKSMAFSTCNGHVCNLKH